MEMEPSMGTWSFLMVLGIPVLVLLGSAVTVIAALSSRRSAAKLPVMNSPKVNAADSTGEEKQEKSNANAVARRSWRRSWAHGYARSGNRS